MFTLRNDPLLDTNIPSIPIEFQDPRDPGLHLSSILACMYGYDTHIYIGDKFSPDEPLPEIMELGLIYESGMKRRYDMIYPGRFITSPKPICVDGIHMTPDLIDMGTDDISIVDFKLTRKSSRVIPGASNDKKWPMAISQVMAYCYGYNISTAVLDICYLLDDYSKGAISPIKRYVYTCTFEQYELNINWESILNFLDENPPVKI